MVAGLEGITIRNGASTNGSALILLTNSSKRGAASLATTTYTIRNCRFVDNSANGRGGAVYVADRYALVLEDTELSGNICRGGGAGWGAGGAIAVIGAGTENSLVMRRCVVENNRSDGPGGGMYITNVHVDFDSCQVRYNTSGLDTIAVWAAGAGVQMNGTIADSPVLTVVQVTRCEFVGNRQYLTGPSGAGDGGGFGIRGFDYGHQIVLHVSECEFRDNFGEQGAGLYAGRFLNALVERCRFVGNVAYYNAGGAYKGGALAENLGEYGRFEYCEFRENRAGYDFDGTPVDLPAKGGAFATRRYPRAEFMNCSFLDNEVGGNLPHGDAIMHYDDGGGFGDPAQQCQLINCAFWGSGGNDVQVRGDAQGFSLVTNCALAPGEFACTGATPVDMVWLSESPYLVGDGILLTAGSACVDSGLFVDSTLDLFGNAVPHGPAVDIGAQELDTNLYVGVAAWDGAVPTSPAIRLEISPNPFNATVSIRYALARRGETLLALYNLAGREIAVLVHGEVPAGSGEIVWGGRYSSGRDAPSGIYFARFESAGRIETRRLLLVR